MTGLAGRAGSLHGGAQGRGEERSLRAVLTVLVQEELV